MKQTFLLIILINTSLISFSQISRNDYIQRYQILAIEEMVRSGIPASITIAQGCLESGNGNSELSRKSNNHFGIKCKKGWKGKKVYYDDDAKNECFRKYKTVEDSYIDHTNFLLDNPRYASLFKLKTTDYKGWAHGLKKAGYATNRSYAHLLIDIIEANKLYRLDYKISYDELITYELTQMGSKGVSNSLSINAFQARKIEKRNRVKSVVAGKGDTYEIIAQRLDIKNWVLYKYNNQSAGYRPRENEIVYIKPKKNKTKKDKLTHRVETGDSMHYISQLYGIKLSPLYRRNQIKKGQQPKVGQIIYLHKRGKG
ncbi:MAG: LysM peptidoglycan-binding domain-containing protein [Draconibacterium sp.]|nr:LysM peptidoglycan-binding domain-containing protein [Draconibacterium sp.]